MAAQTCQECGNRPALAWARRGKPKAMSDHDLCEKCWKALMNRERSRKLAEDDQIKNKPE